MDGQNNTTMAAPALGTATNPDLQVSGLPAAPASAPVTAPTSATGQTPTAATVPMLSPDGKLGDIPKERVNDAIRSGFKVGMSLISPDGKSGVVPLDKVHDAVSSGFHIDDPAINALSDSSGLTGLTSGFAKGAVDTMRGVSNAVGNVTGTTNPLRVPDISTTPTSTTESVGKVGEDIAEFMAGEEGLKALGELPRAMKYLKTPQAVADYINASPKLTKALAVANRIATSAPVSRIAAGGTLGGVQGALKGEATGIPGEAAGEAKAGAEGGSIGAGIGELLGMLPKVYTTIAHGELTPEEAVARPAAGKFQPAADLTSKEVLEHASDSDVDLTPGQALKTKVRQAEQGLGERAFVGGQGLEEAIQENRQKLTQVVSDLADDVDPKKIGMSEERVGDSLQQSALAAKTTARTNAQAAFQALPKDLQTADVDLTAIRQKWDQIAQHEKIAMQNLPTETASRLKQVLELGRNIGTRLPDDTIKPSVSFGDAQKLRSAFREMGETTGADLPARYQGMFRDLTHDFDGAMEKTADSYGYTKQWRQANAGWKDFNETFGDRQSPLYRILNQSDPARITRDILNRGSSADIETLKNAGVDLAPLKRQVVADVAKAGYKINRDGLGGYTDSFLNELLGSDAKQQLYLNAELGRRLGFEVNPSGTSNVLAAEMQIPTSKEGLVRGLVGSTGMAKLSQPRLAEIYLPKPKVPSKTGRAAKDLLSAVGAVTGENMVRQGSQGLASGDQSESSENQNPNIGAALNTPAPATDYQKSAEFAPTDADIR